MIKFLTMQETSLVPRPLSPLLSLRDLFTPCERSCGVELGNEASKKQIVDKDYYYPLDIPS